MRQVPAYRPRWTLQAGHRADLRRLSRPGLDRGGIPRAALPAAAAPQGVDAGRRGRRGAALDDAALAARKRSALPPHEGQRRASCRRSRAAGRAVRPTCRCSSPWATCRCRTACCAPISSTPRSRATRSTWRSAARARWCRSCTPSRRRSCSAPTTPISPRSPIPWSATRRRTLRRACASARSARAAWLIELASNDGYLLQHYRAAGVPVLGIDPAPPAAAAARARGVDTIEDFFGRDARRASGGERPPRRRRPCQQRAGARRRHQRLRRWHRDRAQAGWRRGSRGPLCPRADPQRRVRHDLSSASVLLLGHGRAPPLPAARPVLEPGRASADPRRLASPVRRAGRAPGTDGRGADGGRAGRRRYRVRVLSRLQPPGACACASGCAS